MEPIIYTRKLDKLGRLVIPRDIQREIGISASSRVNMILFGDKIIIEKHKKDVSRYEKPIGIIRALDEMGRVVIACEIREELNIKPKEVLVIYLKNRQIFIEKTMPF